MLNFLRERAVLLLAIMALLTFSVSQPVAQFILTNPVVVGMINSQSALPIGTGCTIAAGSTDLAGSCTTSSTSGSIAFATAKQVAPSCIVQDSTATPVFVYTTTTAQITLTTVTSAHVLFWLCIGKGT